MSVLTEIGLRSPINRAARRGTTYAADTTMSRDELLALTERLTRKRRLLAYVLGIRTKGQKANFTYKWNHGYKNYRAELEPRAAVEYIRVGQEIQRMARRIAELKERP